MRWQEFRIIKWCYGFINGFVLTLLVVRFFSFYHSDVFNKFQNWLFSLRSCSLCVLPFFWFFGLALILFGDSFFWNECVSGCATIQKRYGFLFSNGGIENRRTHKSILWFLLLVCSLYLFFFYPQDGFLFEWFVINYVMFHL